MRRRNTSVVVVALGAAVSLGLAACGGGISGTGGASGAAYNDALTTVVNASEATGGTLRYVHPDDWDSPDPGNTYYAFSWNFGRLYGRTLMTFKNAPGKDGLTLVPDLATGPGAVSNGGKTWTYHIRSGIKYDDGAPVTTKDIKYAIERSNYAPDVLSNGPIYFHDLLGTNYPGPYKDPSPDKLGLTPIETPNDTTIIFHLTRPFPDFDFLATLPQTTPVPPSKDDGAQYENHIVATGPYKIDSYQPGKSMTLSKNPYWSAATDPNHKQTVDTIQVTLKVDANDLDNRLLAGNADIALDGTGVSAAAQSRILNTPTLKANADNPLNGFERYIAISTKVAPFDNIHCRKAVIYAADHVALQTAYGGPVSGDIATTVLPPSILGYQPADVYNMLQDKNGNVTKAKDELAQCGKPNGFHTTIAARSNRPKEINGAQALQQALAKVGISTSIQTFPSGQYFANYAGSTNYAHAHDLGLMFMGWGADWPSWYGYLQQIADGRSIKASGNSNLSELNDPAINALFDKSLTETDVTARTQIGTQIDQKMMADAAIIPIIYEKVLLYRNPEVTNVFVHRAWGMYDYATLGIKQ